MKTLVSKLSLYDILAMFLPGMLILFFFTLVFGNSLMIEESKADKGFVWLLFFLGSYLIGIVNHVATSTLVSFLRFRNNPGMICSAYHNVLSYAGDSKLVKLKDKMKFFRSSSICAKSLSVVVLIISFILVGILCRNKSDDLCYLMILPFLLYSVLLLQHFCRMIKNKCYEEKQVLDNYYKAYYQVAAYRFSDDVFIIEGQVAFLQSMLIPVFLYAFIPDKILSLLNISNLDTCLYIFGILDVILILCLVIFYRQMKIYQIVWEGYAYLKRNENKLGSSKASIKIHKWKLDLK